MSNTDTDFLRALASDLVVKPDEQSKWGDAPARLRLIADKLARDARPTVAGRHARPTIVCLCGSTKFYEAFTRANYEETMAGRIVLSVGFFMHAAEAAHGEAVGCTPEQKVALDELHLRKIDLADEVLILNVGGYIGSSTRRELAYALVTNKRIRFLEPEAGRAFLEEPANAHALGKIAAGFIIGEGAR